MARRPEDAGDNEPNKQLLEIVAVACGDTLLSCRPWIIDSIASNTNLFILIESDIETYF